MSDTKEQERKLLGSIRQRKLLGMLRSTLQKWPRAKLQHSTLGDFGVSLGDGIFLRIEQSGHLTNQDMRDLLALFATWLAVDPERVRGITTRDGSFAMEPLLREQ